MRAGAGRTFHEHGEHARPAARRASACAAGGPERTACSFLLRLLAAQLLLQTPHMRPSRRRAASLHTGSPAQTKDAQCLSLAEQRTSRRANRAVAAERACVQGRAQQRAAPALLRTHPQRQSGLGPGAWHPLATAGVQRLPAAPARAPARRPEGLRCAAHGRAARGAVPRHDAPGADVGATGLERRAVSMASTPARRHGRPQPAPIAGRARALLPLEHCDARTLSSGRESVKFIFPFFETLHISNTQIHRFVKRRVELALEVSA